MPISYLNVSVLILVTYDFISIRTQKSYVDLNALKLVHLFERR